MYISGLMDRCRCTLLSYQVDVKRSMEDGEKRFNQLSLGNLMTLVNLNSIKRQSTTSKRSNGFGNEYIVVRSLL
jgi:hypothetical protein